MNRPRDRQSAVGLLPRMEARPHRDGKTVTYRYHVAGGKPINLGTDRIAAIQKVADMLGRSPDAGTLSALWRQYQSSPAWAALSATTQADYSKCSAPLLKVFGACTPDVIRPADVARYLRIERAASPVRANREVAVLSNLLNLAVELGLIDRNPVKEVRRNKESPRTRAVDPAELQAFAAWLAKQGGQRHIIGLMARFAALAGNRRCEFLDLTWPQIGTDHIRIQRHKQRAKREVWERIEITGDLTDLVRELRTLPRAADCLYVFTNQKGNPYTEGAFNSLWHRVRAQAIEQKVIQQTFTFHDLRAFYATQHKERTGQHAELHQNPATTARVYDRRKEIKRRGL